MVRVGFTVIQDRVEHVLDIGDVELGFCRKRVRHAVDGLVPPAQILCRGVAFFEGNGMLFKIRVQPGVFLQTNQSVGVPRVHKIMT